MPYKNPEIQKFYQSVWINKRRSDFFVGKACTECGSIENLELDHIDPSTKIYQPNQLWGMSLTNSNRVAELAKCQVLCERCHFEKSRQEKVRGQDHKRSVWTDEQVLEMKRLNAEGVDCAEIARRFNGNRKTVWAAVHTGWKHL